MLRLIFGVLKWGYLFSKHRHHMEGLKAVSREAEAANDGIEVLREQAQVEYENLLAGAKYQALETMAEKAGYLRGLILERAATVGDTSVPVDNSQRFLVELLARDLYFIEQAEEIDELGHAVAMV